MRVVIKVRCTSKRRLSDRFAEYLHSVRSSDVDKPVARYFNTSNHSVPDTKVCAAPAFLQVAIIPLKTRKASHS